MQINDISPAKAYDLRPMTYDIENNMYNVQSEYHSCNLDVSSMQNLLPEI